mmetsp:Transcript_31279/g.96639  ORF Transcript_31279/g.96639 Transcript_31279/m.96639 type:complete len:261 (-) Transcript_31279:746-1528(-)
MVGRPINGSACESRGGHCVRCDALRCGACRPTHPHRVPPSAAKQQQFFVTHVLLVMIFQVFPSPRRRISRGHPASMCHPCAPLHSLDGSNGVVGCHTGALDGAAKWASTSSFVTSGSSSGSHAGFSPDLSMSSAVTPRLKSVVSMQRWATLYSIWKVSVMVLWVAARRWHSKLTFMDDGDIFSSVAAVFVPQSSPRDLSASMMPSTDSAFLPKTSAMSPSLLSSEKVLGSSDAALRIASTSPGFAASSCSCSAGNFSRAT